MEFATMVQDPARVTSVVIVDDSDMVRQRLRAMLNQMPGVEVVGEASDAAGGEVMTADLTPDVVILDVMMPGGSGLDLLEQIKGETSAPAVIVLTNYPYGVFRKRAMELGAEYFFAKSSEFDRIGEALENIREARAP